MATLLQPVTAPGVTDQLNLGRLPVAAVISLALMAPMLASGLVFPTYDIAMTSLALEILRQLNAPFVLAELIICAWASMRGFRLRGAAMALDAPARIALAAFAVSFWIGGVFVSKAAAFATLFNLTYAVHIAFLGAIAHLARGWSESDTAVFGRLVALALAGFGAMIAIRFLLPPPDREVVTIRWQFAIPGFISVRLFGAMAGTWCAFMLYLAATRGAQTSSRAWVWAACALTAGMVVWSGTRAAVLGVGTAGMVALLRWRSPMRPGLVAKTSAAAILGCVLAVLLLPYGDRDFWLFMPGDYQGSADTIASGRLALWLASWNAFWDVPLFGAGPGASAWILPPNISSHIQPHNVVIEFLLNWGLVASAAAFFLLAKLVVAAHRKACDVPVAVPFLLAADSLLAMAFFDGTFHFAQHLMLWAALMGIALGAANRAGPKRAAK